MSSSTPIPLISENDDDENDENLLLQHRQLEDSLNYEELVNPSRNSITCPTCSGLGRLPKTSTNELVALVPYNDSRLKPRRTKCLLFAGMSIAAIIFTTLLFALVPRSVTFEEAKHSPNTTNVKVDQEGASVIIDLNLMYKSYNYNYYPVKLNSLDIKVMYELYIVRNVTLTPANLDTKNPERQHFLAISHLNDEATDALDNSADTAVESSSKKANSPIELYPRQEQKFELQIDDIIFSKENHLNLIVDHCLWPWRKFNKIPLQFQSTLRGCLGVNRGKFFIYYFFYKTTRFLLYFRPHG